MSKGLLFGDKEGMVLTPIARPLCARQCANLLTYLIFTLIPEASTKLPTYRGEKQVQRLALTLVDLPRASQPVGPRAKVPPQVSLALQPMPLPIFLFTIIVYTTTQSQQRTLSLHLKLCKPSSCPTLPLHPLISL